MRLDLVPMDELPDLLRRVSRAIGFCPEAVVKPAL